MIVTPPAVTHEASAVVLARYGEALAKTSAPKIVVFDYAVEQLGLRNLVQTHRIYRMGVRERDETRIVDGYTLNPPAIRTLSVGKDRYAIANVAPRPGRAQFRFVGFTYRAGRPQYLFNVKQPSAKAFVVDQIEIDSRSYLPTLVRFDVRTANAQGTGEIAFDRAGTHWLVERAEASMTLADGSPARERILFTSYSFPKQLPATTFETQHLAAPGSMETPKPASTPKPTPTPIVFPADPKVAIPPTPKSAPPTTP